MQPFRFMHAADLHLDSPFKGLRLKAGEAAEVLKHAVFEAWDALIDRCITEQVDFLVVAGDIYDGEERGVRAQLKFLEGLQRLCDKGIASFVVHGNHDPVQGWASSLTWPDKVHIFRADDVEGVETVPFVKGEKLLCHVHGVSYRQTEVTENLAKRFLGCRPPNSPFDVAVLHCNVGGNTGHAPYAPCDLNDLRAAGIDYWALGHVHERKVLAEQPHVVYPGNLQGRSIRECGPRGSVLVDVDEQGRVTTRFLDLDVVRWQICEVSIQGVSAINELMERLRTAVDETRREADRPLVVRVRLQGRGALDKLLRDEDALSDLRLTLAETYRDSQPQVWIEGLRNETRPEVNLEDLDKRQDLLGVLARVKAEQTTDPKALREAALKKLQRTGDYKPYLKFLSDDGVLELLELLDDAFRLCVEGLEPADVSARS